QAEETRLRRLHGSHSSVAKGCLVFLRSSGHKACRFGDSTADDSPSPAAEDTVSDTMEVDDGGKEARTTIPAAPTEPRSLPKARPVVQNKARDVQPRGSGTHVTKCHDHVTFQIS
ncbi:hypothetical protein EDB85DRAFT_1903888, partial [Lactarius pseudohatsudake]